MYPLTVQSSSLMGSSEEEMLVQMVYDFMESESATAVSSSTFESPSPGQLQSEYFTLLVCCLIFVHVFPTVCVILMGFCNILKEVLRNRTEAEGGVLEKVVKHVRNKRDAESSTGLKKWLVRRLKMDGFNASLRQNSWPTTLGCSAGEPHHVFQKFHSRN